MVEGGTGGRGREGGERGLVGVGRGAERWGVNGG